MVDEKKHLSNEEINKLVNDIIYMEKNYAYLCKVKGAEDRRMRLLYSRQRFRRSIVSRCDDISLYSVYNGLVTFNAIIGEDVSFYTDFMKHTLYNRIIAKDNFASTTNFNVERFYTQAVNLAFEFSANDILFLIDTKAELDRKSEAITKFNKRVIDMCSLDEAHTLVGKLREYKKTSDKDAIVIKSIESGISEFIAGEVVEKYFNGGRNKSMRFKK